MPRRPIHSRASASSQRGLSLRPSVSISPTGSAASSGWSWATKPIRGSTARVGVAATRPRTSMLPAVGSVSPTARCSSVVLPAPLGPTSAVDRARPAPRACSRAAPSARRSACRGRRRIARVAHAAPGPRRRAAANSAAIVLVVEAGVPRLPDPAHQPAVAANRSRRRGGVLRGDERPAARAVPRPALRGRARGRPCSTVFGLIASAATTSLTVGSWSPVCSIPSRIACLTWCTSCR